MPEILRAIRVTLVLWVITALIYPFLTIGFAQNVFPYQANGSLIKNGAGKVVGSALIGQSFASTKYFWGRPSTIKYSEGKEVQSTGISAGSNFAPSNPDLIKRVTATKTALTNGKVIPTADLVYSSGSGLDPHISVEAAYAQAPRIAEIRSIFVPKLRSLIDKNTDDRFLWIFGEPSVNVLKLNLALDNSSAIDKSRK